MLRSSRRTAALAFSDIFDKCGPILASSGELRKKDGIDAHIISHHMNMQQVKGLVII